MKSFSRYLNESIDIEAILEAEYPSDSYCVGRFMKECWNSNSRSTIEILIGKTLYCVSTVDDNDDVIYLMASSKCKAHEGVHLIELLQSLKYFNKNLPLMIMLDGKPYEIQNVTDDTVSRTILIEIDEDIDEGILSSIVDKIFGTNKRKDGKYSYVDFDTLSANDEYYTTYNGDHLEFLGKDKDIARFMNTTVSKEVSMPRNKVAKDVMKFTKSK